jgi:hypothetical protein
MAADDIDDLVPFQDVTVIRSTAPALLCAIGNQRVWLLRSQISGKLWCTGDRGKLLVRRSVAYDQHLLHPQVPTPGTRPLAAPTATLIGRPNRTR